MRILIVVGIIAAALGVVIAAQPSTYRVTRNISIATPPDRVFALVDDYHKWDGWSPWAKADPNMKVAYSGPESGAGAGYAWSGNGEVGEGRMTTVAAEAGRSIQIQLEFIKPFRSSSVTRFSFVPQSGGTLVTWDMNGNANFMTKAFSLISSMDATVGPDFEKGLKQLKSLAESAR